MNIIYETNYGKIVNGDNVDVLKELEDSSVDSCISDFPYAIEFMGKNWDSAKHWNTGDGIHGRFEGTGYSGKRRPAFYLNTNEDGLKFYDWCYERAVELMRVMKPGGYVAIFGHPKMNHRMKCAFDDAGFQIVEEIDWIYMCVSADTQILTKSGWKYYNEITNDDFVMTLNTDKDIAEWQKINNIYTYDYSGKMCHIKTRHTDQLITPNHRILHKYRYKKMKNGKIEYNVSDYTYCTAESITPKSGINIPISATYPGHIEIGDKLSWLIGFILGDGHYHKDCNAISIYQTSAKPELVNKIRNTLTYLGIHFSEYTRQYKYSDKINGLSKCMDQVYVDNYIKKHGDDTYTQYQFYIRHNDSEIIRNIIPSINLSMDMLDWCIDDRRQLILGLIESDGCVHHHNNSECYVLYQKDEHFRDIFQMLCFSVGLRTSLNNSKFCVNASHGKFTQIQSKYFNTVCGKKHLPTVDYSGIVWCVSTDNTNFVARRNGKIFITGNSGMPKCQDI